MLSRPSDNGHTPFGDIFYSESPDLTHWGATATCCDRAVELESTKVGAGPTPIETEERLAARLPRRAHLLQRIRLLDGRCPARPRRALARRRARQDYLLSPQVPYEQVGDVPNVVFPCAALVERETDRLTIYYGAADTVVCLAHGQLSEILDFVRGGVRRRGGEPRRCGALRQQACKPDSSAQFSLSVSSSTFAVPCPAASPWMSPNAAPVMHG